MNYTAEITEVSENANKALLTGKTSTAINREAGSIFARAQRAFAKGDHAEAIKLAETANKLVHDNLTVRQHGEQLSPNITIVIVTHAADPIVEGCLRALKGYSEQPDFEILIVNNGSFCFEAAVRVLSRFRWVDVGFNYGPSGARNLGARVALGEFVIFLDDDGIPEDGALKQLVISINKHDAVTVRGQIRPKSPAGIGGSKYSLGNNVCYSEPSAEGFSIWRRRDFLAHEGFDTLLYGGEGPALWARMYPFYGPDGSLYTPDAIFFHDYADDSAEIELKKQRLLHNDRYVSLYYPRHNALRTTIVASRKDQRCKIALNSRHCIIGQYAGPYTLPESFVSLITIASDPLSHCEEYIFSLQHQTHKNFEVVFVYNERTSHIASHLQQLWPASINLRLVKAPMEGPTQLQVGISETKGPICVIAKWDDISHSKRLELIARYFAANPRKSCVSFATYSDDQVLHASMADPPLVAGMRTASLFGMPALFATLAFRKSDFKIDMVANGDEHCWLYDNLIELSLHGDAILLNLVYTKTGLSDGYTDQDSYELIYRAHEKLMGPLSTEDKSRCLALSNPHQVIEGGSLIKALRDYAEKLLFQNAVDQIYDQSELERDLAFRLSLLQSAAFQSLNIKYRQKIDRFRQIGKQHQKTG